jgi:hypothetical protein
VALQNAKALAARALGKTGGTGYVYLGMPKSNAVVAASAPATGAEGAAATAKLFAQGKTFSQASYIRESQFLEAIKEVSLSFDPDLTLGQYISADEQRHYIVKALAQYGIDIRPNTPVVAHDSTIVRIMTHDGGGEVYEDCVICSMTESESRPILVHRIAILSGRVTAVPLLELSKIQR